MCTCWSHACNQQLLRAALGGVQVAQQCAILNLLHPTYLVRKPTWSLCDAEPWLFKGTSDKIHVTKQTMDTTSWSKTLRAAQPEWRGQGKSTPPLCLTLEHQDVVSGWAGRSHGHESNRIPCSTVLHQVYLSWEQPASIKQPSATHWCLGSAFSEHCRLRSLGSRACNWIILPCGRSGPSRTS